MRRVAPNDIIFAGKDAVQKVLIDEDFVKAPVYDDIEMYPGIKSLITERDKSLYKSKVYSFTVTIVSCF